MDFLREHLRLLLVMGTIGGLLIGTLLGLTVGPRTPALGERSDGDPALVADVRSVLAGDQGLATLSVARVRNGQVSYAGLGTEDGQVPTPQTPYELGSITKTFTGLLLADGVERGELSLEDPLAKHLPELAGTPAGAVSLFALATHSSGLPSLAPTGGLAATLGNRNPYAVSVPDLLAATRTVKLEKPGFYAYSNLGMSLLGHAEARAAKAADWPTLARERLLTPLGLTATTFAMTAAEIPAGAVRAHAANGWRAPYWYGAAYAPAGSSTWTTAEDMGRYVSAVLARKVPGLAALSAEAEADNGQIGLAWQVLEFQGRELTWHNGGTAGMHSMLALDPQRGQGVIVLGNSSRSVDRAGLGLAAADGPPAAVDRPALPVVGLAAGAVGIVFLVSFVSAALRGRSRLAIAIGLVSGATGLLVLLAFGPWTLVPAWVWATLTGGASAVAAYAVVRSLNRPRWPVRRRVRGGLSAAASLIVLGCVLYAL